MAMKIRLARGGSKKRPFYRIVAADSRMPRDGRFIEKLGTYNPLLPKDSEERVKMDIDRVKYWLGEGAQVTDRVSRFLEAAGVIEKKERANLKKGKPGSKAVARVEEKAAKPPLPPKLRLKSPKPKQAPSNRRALPASTRGAQISGPGGTISPGPSPMQPELLTWKIAFASAPSQAHSELKARYVSKALP